MRVGQMPDGEMEKLAATGEGRCERLELAFIATIAPKGASCYLLNILRDGGGVNQGAEVGTFGGELSCSREVTEGRR